MSKNDLFNFIVDKKNSKINVEKSFDAPVDLVWQAWTDAEILDQWWAPAPYKCVTKSMDFSEGGRWHYHMLGPGGEKQWCLADYNTIKHLNYFSLVDAFCDENEIINNEKPKVKWENDFTENEGATIINIQLHFDNLQDLETLVQMGFKEGFTAGLENLEKYFSTKR